jgi:hypothetical protein
MDGLVAVALRRIDFPSHWRINGTPASLPPGPSALSSPIASSPLQSESASLPIKAAEVPAAPIGVAAVVTKKPKKLHTSPGSLAVPVKDKKRRNSSENFARQNWQKKKRVS